MYNFHKKKSRNSYHIYHHELFQRGKRHLLNKIKRKTAENSLEKSVHELEVLNSTDHHSDAHQENAILKRLNKDALSKMYALDAKLKELIEQNRELWQEIYKKEKRQEIFSTMMRPYNQPYENEKIEKIQKREFLNPISSTGQPSFTEGKGNRKEIVSGPGIE